MESIRENIRRQLAVRYRQTLENKTATIEEFKETIRQLENAHEKARKTNRRILVEGQEHMGTLSEAEIEDQIAAFRRAMAP